MFAAGVSLGEAKEVVKKETVKWETDFAKASADAKASGKYMLVDFSGSDWCGWCMKLDDEVFSKPAFKRYATSNLVCVLLDFPRQKNLSRKLREQNQKLQQEYKVQGFPTILVLSPEGDTVGKTGYQPGGDENYVDHLQKIIAGYETAHPEQAASFAKARQSSGLARKSSRLGLKPMAPAIKKEAP